MTFEVLKDPNADISWTIDWSDWLNDSTSPVDTISSSTWSIEGTDLALTQDSDSNTTTTATINVSGGTLGKRYKAVNRITTANGEINDRTIVFYLYDQ